MIYKSSTAYSFGKSDKKTDKSLINQSKIKDNPDIYKYQGDIIIKPTKGFKFSKEEKLKTKVRKSCTGSTAMLKSLTNCGKSAGQLRSLGS